MSKSAKPWFSYATALTTQSPSAPSQPPENANSAPFVTASEDPKLQIQGALARGGRRQLLPEFVKELRRVLQEQEAVLALVDSNPSWALPLLNRQYYAIRNAAEVLNLAQLANVASRAEVTANLLDTGIVPFTAAHGRLLVHTHGLLVELVTHVAKRGSDHGCYSITQTALWLYSMLDPALGDYEPGSPNSPPHLH